MKRILTSLMILAFAAGILFAQAVLDEDFDSSNSLPAGWVDDSDDSRPIGVGLGVDGSNAFVANIYFGWTAVDLYTPLITNLPANYFLEFDYRLTEWEDPNSPVDIGVIDEDFFFEIYVYDGEDFGFVWALEEHEPTTDWYHISIPLNDYAGGTGQVNFYSMFAEDLDFYLDNVRIGTQGAAPDHDLRAVSLTGHTAPIINQPADYTLTVRNLGALPVPASDYTVTLMQVGNPTPLGTENGTAIAPNAIVTFDFTHTFTATGTTQLYGVVTYVADENPANNQTSNVNVNVLPEGAVYIGDPNSTDRDWLTPFTLYYKQSIVQTIYYADEIGSPGTINTIIYNFTRGGSTPGNNGYPADARPVKIYMATTTQEEFVAPSDQIPFNDFELVYNGNIPVNVDGNNDIVITLQTPYVYTGNNLVIMTEKLYDTVYYASSNTWKVTHTTPDVYRGIVFFDDPTDAITIPDANGGISGFENIGGTDFIPNVILFLEHGPSATLTGLVSDITTEAPVEGAVITLNGTTRSVTSGADGRFTFPYFPLGTHSVTATKPGWYPLVYDDINTNEGETTDINLVMTALPGAAVTVTINTYDQAPATGAAVLLVNMDTPEISYYAIAGANSQANFPNVAHGMYNITVSKEGYYTYVGEIEVIGTTSTETISLDGLQVLLYEGFENTAINAIPTGWTHTANVQTFPWHVVESTQGSGSPYTPYSGVHMMASASYDGVGNVPLDPNNWLITPQIVISENASSVLLEYYVATWLGNPADDWRDHYGVFVSTTGNAVGNFGTIPIFEETPPESDASMGGANQKWTIRTINLDAYIGQSIYIAFRHYNSANRFWIMIDEVRVATILTNSEGDQTLSIPAATALKGNYPNPFNPSTSIAFDMARDGQVTIDVFNIKGQKVKTLVNEFFGVGSHKVVWNGDDLNGRTVGSGVYFYRMTTNGYSKTQKMLLMK